jgi:hypothetical protein
VSYIRRAPLGIHLFLGRLPTIMRVSTNPNIPSKEKSMSEVILSNRPVEVFYITDLATERRIVRRSVHRVKDLDNGGQAGRIRLEGTWHKVSRPFGSRVWQLQD